MAKSDFLMTSSLSEDFKFQIHLGGITPDMEAHFEHLNKSISIPKKNITHFSKLMEAAKSGLKESIDKLIDIMNLKSGDATTDIDFYFTSAKGQDGKG